MPNFPWSNAQCRNRITYYLSCRILLKSCLLAVAASWESCKRRGKIWQPEICGEPKAFRVSQIHFQLTQQNIRKRWKNYCVERSQKWKIEMAAAAKVECKVLSFLIDSWCLRSLHQNLVFPMKYGNFHWIKNAKIQSLQVVPYSPNWMKWAIKFIARTLHNFLRGFDQIWFHDKNCCFHIKQNLCMN